MPTVRVFLACTSPTNRSDGLFDTFVAVSDEAYRDGDHLRIACGRAFTLGYAGPHRVAAVRRVDGLGLEQAPSVQLAAVRPPKPTVPPMRARLMRMLDGVAPRVALRRPRGRDRAR